MRLKLGRRECEQRRRPRNVHATYGPGYSPFLNWDEKFTWTTPPTYWHKAFRAVMRSTVEFANAMKLITVATRYSADQVGAMLDAFAENVAKARR